MIAWSFMKLFSELQVDSWVLLRLWSVNWAEGVVLGRRDRRFIGRNCFLKTIDCLPQCKIISRIE